MIWYPQTGSGNSLTNLCDDAVEGSHQHNVYSYTHTHKVKTGSQTCVRTVWRVVTNTMDPATHTHTHTKWRQCHKHVWGLCGGWSPTQWIQLHTHTQSEDSVTNLCEDCVEGGHQHNVCSSMHTLTHSQSKDSTTNLCDDSVEGGHQHSICKYMHTQTHEVKTVLQTCVMILWRAHNVCKYMHT